MIQLILVQFFGICFVAIKPLVEKFIQESESSETLSSVFTCFMEMSNRLNLASFFKREKSLVPNILSIMLVKIVLGAMVSTILSFIGRIRGKALQNLGSVS